MGNEMMGLQELATYLQRDAREVSKWASRGYLPGQKVSGEWRFHRAEINQWLETQMGGYDEQELTAIEKGNNQHTGEEPLLSVHLSEATTAVPLQASTRKSVLKELVSLAERSWQVYDPEAILTAIEAREEMGSTAQANGVAIPHPRRPLPNALGESLIAYGRTATGIPFGAPTGIETDIFFLVACRDDRTHLRVLARLSRLMLRPDFLDSLRAAQTASETFHLIEEAERELIG
jgi:nitrogen PTS system EIIA component